MRTVAALCLVAVLLLGGGVVGTALIGGDGGDRPSHAGGVGDDVTEGGDGTADRAPGRTGFYESQPEEDLNSHEDEADDDDEEEDDSDDDDADDDDADDDSDDEDGDDDDGDDDSDEDDADEDEDAEEEDEDDDDEDDDRDDDESGVNLPLLPTSTETPTPNPTPTTEQTPTSAPAPSSSVRVVDAEVDESEVTVGEYVTVTATVENNGDEEGTHEAELQVDGGGVATESVSVPPGETETVEFVAQFESPGSYDLAVDGTSAGTVAVRQRDAEATSGEVAVIDAVMPADQVRPGAEVTVRATVENPNERPVNATLNVTVDGEVVQTANVSLAPRERTEVRIPFEATGGRVAVEGVDAGHLNVSESLGGGGGDEGGSSERAGVAFGVLAAMGVILSALVVAATVHWRHRDAVPGADEGRK